MTSAAAFALRATVHSVTKYSPAQLAFNRDLILRTGVLADIEMARLRKEKAIQINNQRENKRRIAYKYKEGDKVLILADGRFDPKMALHQGPYKVLSFDNRNGTLRILRNHYEESINMRRVRPYHGN